jgi:sialate O-acetylesterase
LKNLSPLIFCIALILSSSLLAGNSCSAPTDPTLKSEVRSTFKLGSLFKNHMVLQRNQSIHVWGKAKVGATITVTFVNSEKSTVVGANGDCRIYLNAL